MVQDDMYWIFLEPYLLDTNPTKSIDALHSELCHSFHKGVPYSKISDSCLKHLVISSSCFQIQIDIVLNCLYSLISVVEYFYFLFFY